MNLKLVGLVVLLAPYSPLVSYIQFGWSNNGFSLEEDFVSFNESEKTEIDYRVLYDRIQKQKMDELFSEPYDGDMEDDEWWLRELSD